MADEIRTITDASQQEKIFYKFFMRREVYLKTKSGDLKIHFYGYTQGQIALRIPFVKNMYDSCLIFTRSEGYTIYASLKLVEKQEEEVYTFFPLKMQIINAARREDRKSTGFTEGAKSVIRVTNIVSDFIVQNSLAMENKKVDKVRDAVRADLEKQFKFVKLYFCSEGTTDVRMKHFMENKVPYLIPEIGKKESVGNESVYNTYINTIFAKDYALSNKKDIISELAVPVLYKARLPYGYIQANHTARLSEAHMSLVKRIATRVDEVFTRSKLFPVPEEKFLVSDLSKGGVGIVFKERRFIRYFREGSQVVFDIILPGNKKATCIASVRNIAILENKIIKIGCQIKELDPLSEVNYDEFLESAGLAQREEPAKEELVKEEPAEEKAADAVGDAEPEDLV
ncbi:MAG: hypothetical protein EPN93_21570 [Spirochaetes bacterium]|nr:MAG: hypothetical protein EPN93_21570 [Spirochaetota bacterium]